MIKRRNWIIMTCVLAAFVLLVLCSTISPVAAQESTTANKTFELKFYIREVKSEMEIEPEKIPENEEVKIVVIARNEGNASVDKMITIVVDGDDLFNKRTSIPPNSEVSVVVTWDSDDVTKGTHEINITVDADWEVYTIEVEGLQDVSGSVYLGVVAGIVGLVVAGVIVSYILKQDQGTKKMRKISKAIFEGSMTFLNKEYKALVIFAVAVIAILAVLIDTRTAAAFGIGAVLSAATGNIGMRIATSSNARTAQGAKKDIDIGLKIAFSSGAVMGLCVVSLGVLGVCGLYLLFGDPGILFGFGFGASSIALFARVGGGIFTKSADVGADLVGKVEAGIPEDDPRNPAVIADNVGDNVGDVAGMGADLFESYVDSIIAAMALGTVTFIGGMGMNAAVLPIVIAGVGIIAAILGVGAVSLSKTSDPRTALNIGVFGSALLMAIFSYFIIQHIIGDFETALGIFFATIGGLGAGLIIGMSTDYYTSEQKAPAQSIAEASETGPATNIITGLSIGMMSTVIPIIAVCAVIIIAYHFAGLYGIAIAAVGMLSTLGITLATDTYGPVADNAAGIAEMAGMGKEVRERAESLDAVGNSTAAVGKGFAIGSAALTALALFAVYGESVGLEGIDLLKPTVIVGVFIGALLPFVFSALTMSAVGKTAMCMVNEVRRQFKEIKGLMEGKAEPDSKKCVDIATGAALKQMIVPSLLAVISPIVVGLVLGVEALGGLLAGSIVSGFLLAILMANAGGAWDNAKKYIESGHHGGKGSESHKAAVIGDTVGDPFKDTSGPSLNILIKLMSIVALVFVPLFLKLM